MAKINQAISELEGMPEIIEGERFLDLIEKELEDYQMIAQYRNASLFERFIIEKASGGIVPNSKCVAENAMDLSKKILDKFILIMMKKHRVAISAEIQTVYNNSFDQ